ncbi:SDR family oxidoreductase [Microbacterium sp. CH12i]|uniref:SDR family oxidoreductase n=1 Tax=Microbacterium sp. CH12i TaxID=1479651 RepID=UPI003FA59D3F
MEVDFDHYLWDLARERRAGAKRGRAVGPRSRQADAVAEAGGRMSVPLSLQGRVVAITGGANGIGRETAALLVDAGARVAIGDYGGDAARRAAKDLGRSVVGFNLDVTDSESFAAFVASVESECGPIDILVNSAGVMWVGSFEDEPEIAARRQLDVNLLGVIHSVKLLAPRMRARGAGRIITIASAASILPTPGEATYAASKHGVLGYLKAVRAELRKTGVQLAVIMPTVVDTALAAGTSTGSAAMLQPADIARAVLRTIARPRFEVTVPGYVGVAYRIVSLLPQRLRDAVLGRMVPDQVASVDRQARSGYEGKFTQE